MQRTTILSFMFLTMCVLVTAGALEPSGSPAPTMKTLNEVEARIPIRPSEMPITIGNPGSYYLTGNFTASSATYAIFISTEHVTVDLNGYSLNGNNKLGRDAVQIDAGMKYTTIRNGYIFNWSGNGINGEEADRTYVENVHVDSTGYEGIFLASAAKAIGCSATNCSDGFTLGSDSIAVRCTARNNTNNGFGTWENCLLAECVASGNGTDGLQKAQTPAQAEPRIPIPASSSAAGTFTVSQSGSYYLQGNRVCSGTGIQVNVDDVTIDLMGYTLKGPDSGTCYGVSMNNRNNVKIHNGTIRDFTTAIYDSATTSKNHNVTHITAISNTVSGIALLGSNCQVSNCTSSDNGANATSHVYGIRKGENAIVSSNTVEGNGSSTAAGAWVYGIYTSNGSTVSHNTVCSNGTSGGYKVYGIVGVQDSVITDNNIRKNGTSAHNDVLGISTSSGSVITGNAVYDNGDNTTGGTNVYGILTSSGSTVKSNTIYSNGTDAYGNVYGFYIGSGSVVKENTSSGNGARGGGNCAGYRIETGCVVTGNTAYMNGSGSELNAGFWLAPEILYEQNKALIYGGYYEYYE